MFKITIVYNDEREDEIIKEAIYPSACSIVNKYISKPDVKSASVKEI